MIDSARARTVGSSSATSTVAGFCVRLFGTGSPPTTRKPGSEPTRETEKPERCCNPSGTDGSEVGTGSRRVKRDRANAQTIREWCLGKPDQRWARMCVDRQLLSVVDHLLVYADVILSHAARGELLLETSAYLSTIQAPDALDGTHPGIRLDHKPGHAIFDDFSNRAAWERDNRCTAGHRFDHDEAERFRPADRK